MEMGIFSRDVGPEFSVTGKLRKRGKESNRNDVFLTDIPATGMYAVCRIEKKLWPGHI
jgi:hypothetical protein